MAAPDIGKLKIDRGSLAPKRRRRIRWWWVIVAVVVLGGAAMFLMPHPVQVQTASVVTRYPAQQVTVLTASGYVVAQRKAAVATKGTGRLEELNVQEGSRVKKGDLLARIDARDVQAQLAAAQANVGVARAAIASAEADQRNAQIELKRSRDLVVAGLRVGVDTRCLGRAQRPGDGRDQQHPRRDCRPRSRTPTTRRSRWTSPRSARRSTAWS